MFNNISLGVYYPGNSLMHRLSARTKLLLIFWFALFFTIANHRFWHFVPYIVVVLILCAGVALAGISPGYMFRRLRLLILFALIGIIPAIFFSSAADTTTLATWGPMKVAYSALRLAMAGYGVALVLCLLVLILPFPTIRAFRQSRLFKRLRVLLIVLTLIAVVFLWITHTQSGNAALPLGPIVLTYDGIWLIFSLFVVFLSLYSFSLILTMTTSPIALIEGLTLLLTPLRRIRLPVDDFALMTLIALRFIPTLLEEIELLVKAQMSRGADIAHGSLRERLQSLAALFIPFIQGTLRRAGDLATALESRGYEVQGQQTQLHTDALQWGDYAVMGVVVIVTVGALFI